MPLYQSVCARCEGDQYDTQVCNSCNSSSCQGCVSCQNCNNNNDNSSLCNNGQYYNKGLNICTSNNEYISYEDSWEPIINAINEIYDTESQYTKGSRSISSKITNTGDTNVKFTASLFNEATSRLSLNQQSNNTKILGTYFDDILNKLNTTGMYSGTLCTNCNSQCNSCNTSCNSCNSESSSSSWICQYCNACDICQSPVACEAL